MTKAAIFYDESYTNVGIKMSGGADSSMVYYMLCDMYRDRPDVSIYALTLSTSGKPYYADFAARVIDVVGGMTGRYPTHHFTKFIDHSDWGNSEPYNRGQEDLVEEVKSAVDLDIIYSGLTQNPDPNDMRDYLMGNLSRFNLNREEAQWHLDTRDRSRDPQNFNLAEQYTRNKPFIHGDKKLVAAAYDEYDLMGSLYPYTFSCEAVNEYKGIAETKHCGTCFFCLERYYAFGRLT